NINAFQHAWFALLAAKLGYHGVVKWDAYFGKYDLTTLKPSASHPHPAPLQAFGLIGHPSQKWPLRPVYQLMRLLTQTVKSGWDVVEVDCAPGGTKLVVGFAGPGGERTVIGLDTAGAHLNSTSTTVVSYGIGGLPKTRPLRLLYWNHFGQGKTAVGDPVRMVKGTVTVK